MCFSATASFIAGGTLSAAGLVTLPKAKKRELPLASIPFLLGIQQLIDGVVWITSDASILHTVAVYAYSAFAFAIWPLFTPLAIILIETDIARRRILIALLIIGVGVSLFFLDAMVFNGATAQMLHNCIAYTIPHEYEVISLAFYLVAVIGPFLVSSKKMLRVFGITLLLSFAVAWWFYEKTFSSTWCFFSALLSGILFIYFHQGSRRRGQKG